MVELQLCGVCLNVASDRGEAGSSGHFVREERDLSLCLSLSHGLATRDTSHHDVALDRAAAQTLNWEMQQQTGTPQGMSFLFTVMCTTQSCFHEFGRVIHGTAHLSVEDALASIGDQVRLTLVNVSAFRLDPSDERTWDKGSLTFTVEKLDVPSASGEMGTTGEAYSRAQRMLSSQYDNFVAPYSGTMQALWPKLEGYHITDYPHPYIKDVDVPFFLALDGSKERMNGNFAPLSLYTRLLDCALDVEDVSAAQFDEAYRLQMASDGPTDSFHLVLSVVSRTITIFCLSRPYTYDVCKLGLHPARERRFAMGRYGVMPEDEVEGVDGVVSFNTGACFRRLCGDCEDGVFTVLLLINGLRAQDLSEHPRLLAVSRILGQYSWMSTVMACAGNGHERDHASDFGVCHAVCIGFSKTQCYNALDAGFSSVSSHRSGWVSTVRENIAAAKERIPLWAAHLPPITMETTNMARGLLCHMSDVCPGSREMSEASREKLQQQDEWIRERESRINCILQEWMVNGSHANIHLQTLERRRRFVDSPDSYRMYKFYEYAVSASVYDVDNELWAGTGTSAVRFMFGDPGGRVYGQYLQRIVMGEGFSLVPSVVVDDAQLATLKAKAWDMGFPVFFDGEAGVELPSMEDVPEDALSFFKGCRYGQEAGAPVITFFARDGQLNEECGREFSRLAASDGGYTVYCWKMNVTQDCPIYKISLWRARRLTSGRGSFVVDISNERSRHGIPPISSCRGEGVEELWAGNCGLMHLPTHVDAGPLSSLKLLDVSHNRLQMLPSSLTKLCHLEELRAFHNEIQVLPEGIWTMRRLKRALLQHNLLTEIRGPFSELCPLETLYLQHNAISRVGEEIYVLPGLQTLNLSHNRLKTLPANLGGLQQLGSLDVSHNRLTTLPSSLKRVGRTMELLTDWNASGFKIPAEVQTSQDVLQNSVLVRGL